MSKDIDQPVGFEDRIGGGIQIENYRGDSMELADWNLTSVMDDVLVVQFADTSEDGTMVKRGSMWVPIDVCLMTWRIGQVKLAGPSCKQIKPGMYVLFPNDRGLQVRELNGMSNVVFLNESRIFGEVQPKDVASAVSMLVGANEPEKKVVKKVTKKV